MEKYQVFITLEHLNNFENQIYYFKYVKKLSYFIISKVYRTFILSFYKFINLPFYHINVD